jgi:beta-1,4-mannosyltransferase
MEEDKLLAEYFSVEPDLKKLFVVPLIDFNFQKSDYLYLLYEPYLNKKEFEVKSLSVYAHYKLITSRLKNENSLLHYHWLEFQDLKSLMGIIWKIKIIILYKLLGGKIIWTIHNRHPHRGKFLKANLMLQKFMSKRADRLNVHCSYAVELMSKQLEIDKKKFFVTPHPKFPAEIFPKEKSLAYLNVNFNIDLKIDDQIFLMFGNIIEYKGIDSVIKIFSQMPEKKLIIAGGVKKGSEAYYKALISLAENKNNIFIVNKKLTDAEIPYFFNSADYVIFNFKHILTSGGVVMALNYEKKIIAPHKGCLKEINNERMYFFDDTAGKDLNSLLSRI